MMFGSTPDLKTLIHVILVSKNGTLENVKFKELRPLCEKDNEDNSMRMETETQAGEGVFLFLQPGIIQPNKIIHIVSVLGNFTAPLRAGSGAGAKNEKVESWEPKRSRKMERESSLAHIALGLSGGREAPGQSLRSPGTVRSTQNASPKNSRKMSGEPSSF